MALIESCKEKMEPVHGKLSTVAVVRLALRALSRKRV